MKELSIEEKAQRYDEVIEGIQEILSSGQDSIKMSRLKLRLQGIFPELTQSEDERIRKELIRAFKSLNTIKVWNGIERTDILAWLEKQGNPTDINPSEFDLRLNRLLKQFETLPKEELASSLSFYLNLVQNDGTYREEKQCEVPVTINIDKMVEDYANNKECDNEGFGKPVNCMIRAYRQGLTDAIVILNLRKQGKNLIMAKSPQLGEQKSVISDDALREGVANFGITQYQIDNWLKKYVDVEHKQKTATKEQCDTLMKAMADAGYTFDFEKKELKKISQRMISAEAKEAMYGKPTTWSEEDELKRSTLIHVVKKLQGSAIFEGLLPEELIDWLKSLKDRVGCEINCTTTWKPSEEQIMCLQDALSDYHRRGYKAETLETLLEQLKQL